MENFQHEGDWRTLRDRLARCGLVVQAICRDAHELFSISRHATVTSWSCFGLSREALMTGGGPFPTKPILHIRSRAQSKFLHFKLLRVAHLALLAPCNIHPQHAIANVPFDIVADFSWNIHKMSRSMGGSSIAKSTCEAELIAQSESLQ